MPSSLLDTLFAIGLPCLLLGVSLYRIFEQGRLARTKNVGDLAWLAVTVMVNVLATLWAASMLDLLRIHGRIPAATVAYSYSAGPYLFTTLLMFLLAPTLGPGARCMFAKLRSLLK